MGSFLWGQLAIQISFSIFMIIYLPWHRPLESKFATFMEVMNEETILILTYLLMCFTDFVPDVTTRGYIGYYSMAMVCLHLGVCFFFMLKSSYKGVVKRIKVYFFERRQE